MEIQICATDKAKVGMLLLLELLLGRFALDDYPLGVEPLPAGHDGHRADSDLHVLLVQVDAIKERLPNEEQKVGADIVKRSLGYPLKLIANNAGVNGSVVQQKVLDSADPNLGFNASTGKPTLVSSVTRTFQLRLFLAVVLAVLYLKSNASYSPPTHVLV